MSLVRKIARKEEPYDFVDPARQEKAQIAIDKGLEVILAMQVKIDGKPTVWCAQHDRETLEPAKARAYELPSLSGGESVGIIFNGAGGTKRGGSKFNYSSCAVV